MNKKLQPREALGATAEVAALAAGLTERNDRRRLPALAPRMAYRRKLTPSLGPERPHPLRKRCGAGTLIPPEPTPT